MFLDKLNNPYFQEDVVDGLFFWRIDRLSMGNLIDILWASTLILGDLFVQMRLL